jgi:hypothetical protein
MGEFIGRVLVDKNIISGWEQLYKREASDVAMPVGFIR